MATAPLQLDANITREELEGVMQSSAGYDYPADLRKAWNYIHACRAWLNLPLAETEHAGERGRLEPQIVERAMLKAERWVTQQSVASMPPVSYAPAPDWRC